MTLKGKNIIITGASGGIGREIALEVAVRGATPILMARSQKKLEEVKEEIKNKTGMDALVYSLDVSNLDNIKRDFQDVLSKVPTIDCLVNNAGFGIFDDVLDMKLEDMHAMFEVNVFGLIACTKMVLPVMVQARNGHIINIASQAGKIATPKSSVYSASKHAVLGFTNSLRMELAGTGVKVTSVNPGPIKTNFFNIADSSGNYASRMERFMLNPEKVAKIIVDSIFTNKREINLPRWMSAASKIYHVFPQFVEKVAGNAFRQK